MSRDPETGYIRPTSVEQRARWCDEHKKRIAHYWANRYMPAYRVAIRDNIREARFYRDYRLPREIAAEQLAVRVRRVKNLFMLP